MAGTTVDIGTGSLLVFTTSSFTSEILEMNWEGIERPVIATSNLATAAAGADQFGGATFKMGDIVDGGTLTATITFTFMITWSRRSW